MDQNSYELTIKYLRLQLKEADAKIRDLKTINRQLKNAWQKCQKDLLELRHGD